MYYLGATKHALIYYIYRATIKKHIPPDIAGAVLTYSLYTYVYIHTYILKINICIYIDRSRNKVQKCYMMHKSPYIP